MQRFTSPAIILNRTDFEDAARIITFITPDHGKVRAIARGVRKSKSKMAGSLELFSISEVSFLIGKSEVYTITSTRLVKHFGNIVKDLDRTTAAYEFLVRLDKVTPDSPEAAYFDLLASALEALDEINNSLELIKSWFDGQLLRLGGHTPNLKSDVAGQPLNKDVKYDFEFSKMAFTLHASGKFRAEHIKLLRLVFSPIKFESLAKVQGADDIAAQCLPLLNSALEASL